MELILAPHKILIERIEEKEIVRSSGIVLTQSKKTPLLKGKIKSVGLATPEKPMHPKAGDIIGYRTAIQIEVDEVMYDLISSSDYLYIERP